LESLINERKAEKSLF